MSEPDVGQAARLDAEKLRALLPTLGSAGLEESAAAACPRRGRVLKVKLGFNPNSSSVGTTVVVFLWTLVASGAVLAFTSAVLAYRFRRKAVVPGASADDGSTERTP